MTALRLKTESSSIYVETGAIHWVAPLISPLFY